VYVEVLTGGSSRAPANSVYVEILNEGREGGGGEPPSLASSEHVEEEGKSESVYEAAMSSSCPPIANLFERN